MNSAEVLTRIDTLIQSRSILNHPFYRAWQRGALTREQLATYARVYYPHVAAFPAYLENAVGRSEDAIVRDELAHNLSEELSEPKPHPELWLDFGEELGLTREAMADAVPHPAAAGIVDTFKRLTNTTAATAVAALYAYESQQPEVSRQKMDGLRSHYGVSSDKALAYFDVHARVDIRHREGERLALLRCLEGGASIDSVLQGVDEALNAYWHLLDGVCEEAHIAQSC